MNFSSVGERISVYFCYLPSLAKGVPAAHIEVMRIASVAEVKAKLSSFLDESATGPIVVTRNGKAVAVLLGVEDDDELERVLLANSRKLRAILDAAERRIKEGAGIGHD